MSMGIESSPEIHALAPGDADRPHLSALFSLQALSGEQFIIKHPFHGPQKIGDRSVFTDPAVDDAAAVLLEDLGYLVDSRKLNRIQRYETRPYAGEYPQLSHCMSLGLMGAAFGGGPLDIVDGLYNDAPHVYDGHQGDDNYQGHGMETLHDLTRGSFFVRSGVMERFVDVGVLRRHGHGYQFGKTNLYLETLLDEDEATVRRTFMSNKHPARRMDSDKFQYNEEERLLVELYKNRDMQDPTRVPLALAKASLESVRRMIVLDDGEGDQLVFVDPVPAVESAKAYVEHNALHWTEPVQDLVNDLLNLGERQFFVSDSEFARAFHYFYPRDYLHTSATLMHDRFDNVAREDPFMGWLMQTAQKVAIDQRQKMAKIIDEDTEYNGPNPIDGVVLESLDSDHVEADFRVENGDFVIDLPKGKLRTVDPRIITGRRETTPLSECDSGVGADFREHQAHLSRWIGNYRARITIDDPALIPVIEQGVKRLKEQWPRALRRIQMPAEEFQANIKEANEYVKQRA